MSAFRRRNEKLLKHEAFADLFPYLEYWEDEKLFLLEGPYLGFAFRSMPTNGGNREILNSLTGIYKTKFPKGTLIQASLISSPDIENQLYGFRAARTGRYLGKDQEQVSSIANAVHDFYRKGTNEGINESDFIFRTFEFIFTIKIPIKQLVPTSNELTLAKDVKKRALRSLSILGAVELDDVGFRRRLRVMFNMFNKDKWRTRPHFKEKSQSSGLMRDQILDPGKRVEIEGSGIKILDEKDKECEYIKSLSVTEMPENMVYGQMMDLLGDWLEGKGAPLTEHFMITLNMYYEDAVKAIKDIKSKRSFINSQAKGKLVQWVDRLRFQNKDFNDINREIEQEKSTIVKYALQVNVFAKNEERADVFAEELIAFYERKGCTLVDNNFFTVPMFISSLPLGLSEEVVNLSGRYNVCTSKALPFLTPHMGSWAGNTSEPRILLTSRLGQLVNIDFFKSQTNYNFYIAATSGAGKSFFTGYLIANMLSSGVKLQDDPDNPAQNKDFDDGTQVFVIDVGRSYEGLAKQLHEAQFLVFNKDLAYTLNPFSYIHEFDGEEGQGIQCLAQLKTMAAPSGKISDFQSSQMLTLLTALWNDKGNKACIDDYYELCVKSEHEAVREIGHQLKPFCKGYYYGAYFDPEKPPVDFSSRLVVVELEELKGDPHLQTIALMSVIMSIQQTMYLGGQARRRMFLLDEAWEYLKGDEATKARLGFFSQFLETAWRRFRKYNAAGGLITQSVMDGYSSDVGRAILDNSNWLLLLKQREEAVEKLQNEKAYSGSELDFKLIKSTHTVQPDPSRTDVAYSEIFIKYEGQSQVCRLYTDRRIQLTLTTNADEKQRRQELIDNGYSFMDAIDQMVLEDNRQ